jgi:hypothetical protein
VPRPLVLPRSVKPWLRPVTPEAMAKKAREEKEMHSCTRHRKQSPSSVPSRVEFKSTSPQARKGDGPKFGLTKEALHLWNSPIKIKLQDKKAVVNYPSLIGECLKPQLSSLLGIEDSEKGCSSVDNETFISRVSHSD